MNTEWITDRSTNGITMQNFVKEDANTDIVNKLKEINDELGRIQRYEIETWPQYEDEGGGWYLNPVTGSPNIEDLVQWEDVKKIKELLEKTLQDVEGDGK
jgi:nitrogen regulatory protein PII-like uncharacterized protein